MRGKDFDLQGGIVRVGLNYKFSNSLLLEECYERGFEPVAATFAFE
jgi:hypothetical protein